MIDTFIAKGYNIRSMTISYYPEASCICLIQKYPITFELEINYVPVDNKYIEFNSLDDWLLSLADKQFTIETFTAYVFSALLEALGDIPVRLLVTGRTPVHGLARAELINEGVKHD